MTFSSLARNVRVVNFENDFSSFGRSRVSAPRASCALLVREMRR